MARERRWEPVLPLPEQTAAKVGPKPRPDDNLGLWLDKFLPRDRADSWKLVGEFRRQVLERLCGSWRSQAAADALQRRQDGCRQLEAQLLGRLLVDHGKVNVAETTLSFHPIWAAPRIPGSALKGVCRQRLVEERGEVVAGRLLGAPGQAAAVEFLDALPADGQFTLALDVLTPHYGDYYRGEEPPGDWLSPVPHTFLTVVPPTTFVFGLLGEAGPVAEVVRVLGQVLVERGVGGKSAAGYGYFELV